MNTGTAEFVERIHLPDLVHRLRSQGKTIGTLNGSFDLLHCGHLYIIQEAARQADVLIVGVNSDVSVKQYKDPSRPICRQEERVAMLSAIRWIDYVTVFDEPNPISLLEQIRPDVHTNGAEYGHDCIEAPVVRQHGGRIHLVDRIPTLSTTDLIKRVARIEGL